MNPNPTPKNLSLSLKHSREKMISAIKQSDLPAAFQDLLVAEIGMIDPKHDLLQLDFVRHAHGVGANACYTIKEL